MVTGVEKLTISLPRKLIELTDEIAKERGITRSKLVSECLRDMIDRRLRKQMEEGYQAMAKEHEQFARISAEAATEVVPPWNHVI